MLRVFWLIMLGTPMSESSALLGSKEGSPAVPPPPLFTYPKQKHDHISLCIIIIRPFEALYKFLKISGSRTPLGHSQLWTYTFLEKTALMYIKTMLVYCWSNFCDADPTLKRHNLNVSCLLGYDIDPVLIFMLSNTRNYILF